MSSVINAHIDELNALSAQSAKRANFIKLLRGPHGACPESTGRGEEISLPSSNSGCATYGIIDLRVENHRPIHWPGDIFSWRMSRSAWEQCRLSSAEAA